VIGALKAKMEAVLAVQQQPKSLMKQEAKGAC
jgi:hypothetical protein